MPKPLKSKLILDFRRAPGDVLMMTGLVRDIKLTLLGEPAPYLPMFHKRNKRSRYLKAPSQHPLRLRRTPNESDRPFGEFGKPVVFASAVCAVLDLIRSILLGRTPAQIRSLVISRIAVAVSCLLALRARADERFQHKPMNKLQRSSIVAAKNYTTIAFRHHLRL